jgi:predicted RNA-binding protein associated with RNAse of E/G family
VTNGAREVRIHYLRPPDDERVYVQRLVHDDDRVKVTLAEDVQVDEMIIGGRRAMEPGCHVVWFTFPGVWHDIGRFYLADLSFAGFYANILTPAEFHGGGRWSTTDLFLDVWLSPDGRLTVLDQDQFQTAIDGGVLPTDVANRALGEVADIEAAARSGQWPPPVVLAWDLERAVRASAT